jgi:protein-disulfide isomerase
MRRIRIDGRPVRGPADAPVTLVLFGDFQCPYTGRAWAAVRDVALARRPEQVRLLFKHLPDGSTHPWAEDASLAAECAAQQSEGGFWALHDTLFEQQARLSRETLPGAVAEMARANGLDADRLAACIRDGGAGPLLDADRAEAAALGVTETPTLFVNGIRLTGAPTDESLAHAIDDALHSAR